MQRYCSELPGFTPYEVPFLRISEPLYDISHWVSNADMYLVKSHGTYGGNGEYDDKYVLDNHEQH